MLFPIIVAFNSCKEKARLERQSMSKDEVEDLEKEAFALFQKDPRSALPAFKKILEGFQQLDQNVKVARANLNIANIYDEHLNQIDSAQVYAQASLSIWKQENDSMQVANLLKYVGLLYGKAGQFKQAELNMKRAIRMYTSLGFEEGIAVSKHNLADVYLRKGNLHQSLSILKESTSFWRAQGNQGRVYSNNILEIEIQNLLGENDSVQALLSENNVISKETELDDLIVSRYEQMIKNLNLSSD